MLRCALIGYGAWGSHHARVMSHNPEASLMAIAARTPATQDKARHEHPACRVYGDYRVMLDKEQLDAVAVVLPSHLHAEAGAAVLESGRHLLLEKPMCLSVAECRRLNALAEQGGRVLAVGHEMRLSSLWGKVKSLIDGGAIGAPLYILIELWRKPYRLGADGWRYDIQRVGNWILEEPIHFFDLARWCLAPAAQPVSVYARANAQRPDHPELQDHFSATVAFSGGQFAVIAQCLGGWEHHQIVKVSGTEGALWAAWSGAMDRTFEPSFSLKLRRGEVLEEIPIPRAAGEVFELEDQFQRFVRCIQSGGAPAATGIDGEWSVRLCLKAQQSVEKGMPVAVDGNDE
ncbi:MAG: Gfo/Idh/MocA family oxidoreductase [Gemmataceae bacterium]|nr:Gfo/Idh/MocA family oxidoreductase [Gemmataceae bacterium]